MEEKVLIKSEQYDVKKVFKVMVIIGAILSVIMLLSTFGEIGDDMEWYEKDYKECYSIYLEHQQEGECGSWYDSWEKCNDCEWIIDHPSKLSYALNGKFERYFLPPLMTLVAFALWGAIIYFWLRSYELTVTDKRIFGKVAWGKRVDLPVDSVSATATIRLLKGVSVSTSSGRISFLVIKNADEIYTVMNNLMIERQQERDNATATANVPKSDEADQLKKYKDLLDSGVITQEEFDAKKKQLLGL